MLDLVAALKTARTLRNFVEDGGLEEALASIDLSSAQEAMRKAAVAQDSRGQLWSAVNHLEGADEALRRVRSKRRIEWLNEIKSEALQRRHKYILCLLAICCQYLGETLLRDEVLQKADQVDRRVGSLRREQLKAAAGQPLIYVRFARTLATFGKIDIDYYPGDVADIKMDAFRRNLHELE